MDRRYTLMNRKQNIYFEANTKKEIKSFLLGFHYTGCNQFVEFFIVDNNEECFNMIKEDNF